MRFKDIIFALTINIDPVPKGRPRVANGRAYTPQRTKDYEDYLKLMTQSAMSQLGLEPTPYDIGIEVGFSQETRRNADIDNLLKAVLDALNEIAFVDDRQIVRIGAALDRGVGKGKGEIHIIIYRVANTHNMVLSVKLGVIEFLNKLKGK